MGAKVNISASPFRLEIDPADMGDPRKYVQLMRDILQAMLARDLTPLDAKRLREEVSQLCEQMTGMSPAEAAKQTQDPICRFAGLMESSAKELAEVKAAIEHIQALEGEDPVKKKWLRLICDTIALQNECRKSPAKAWVYISRDQESGGVLMMEKFHLEFFDIWNDPKFLNSLVMAPPGHGKTTCFRGQILWEIGDNPSLRCLVIYDTLKKAQKEIPLLKATIRSPRYQAIFPDVVILGRAQDAADTSLQFTVSRRNWTSREPTVEGSAIGSSVNGNGYDRIYGDDISPPDVRYHEYLRRTTNETWKSVVEERLRQPLKARIRVIATPWHEDDTQDTIARDAKNGLLPTWRVEIDRFSIRDDAKGKPIPLWPARFPTDVLLNKRQRLGQQYTPNYRLRPSGTDTKIVTRIMFYPAVVNQYTTQNDRELLDTLVQSERWLSIDPSGSAGKDSSRHGVVEFVITPGNYAFATDAWFHQMSPPAMLDWIIGKLISAPGQGYRGLIVEAQGGMKGMVTMWEDQLSPDRLKERGYTKPLEIITPGTRVGSSQNRGKMVRHMEAAPYYNGGIIRFAGQRNDNDTMPGNSWLGPIKGNNIDRLTSMLKTFDGFNLSDGVDACNQFVLYFRGRLANPNLPHLRTSEGARELTGMGKMLRDQIEMLSRTRETSAYADDTEFMESVTGAA